MIKFEFAEAALLVEVMGCAPHDPVRAPRRHLWSRIRAAMQINRVHETWRVDADELEQKLFELSEAEAADVLDRIQRYFEGGPHKSRRRGLAAAGLISDGGTT